MNTTKQEKLCKNCAKSIPIGGEIKIESVLWDYEYSVNHGRYSGGWRTYSQPIEKAFYYLCQPCFRKYEKLIAKQKKKGWKSYLFWTIFGIVIFGGLITLIIMANWWVSKNKK